MTASQLYGTPSQPSPAHGDENRHFRRAFYLTVSTSESIRPSPSPYHIGDENRRWRREHVSGTFYRTAHLSVFGSVGRHRDHICDENLIPIYVSL
ncbi:hypothetical protein PILCRDRAFT_14752 [Piloderma croceum F 1598]|nr:hypothetical protein PILCRDRAFT_14752 [Piloderma croceum F 1598]